MADTAEVHNQKQMMQWYNAQYESLTRQATTLDDRARRLDEREQTINNREKDLYDRERKAWQWNDDLANREQRYSQQSSSYQNNRNRDRDRDRSSYPPRQPPPPQQSSYRDPPRDVRDSRDVRQSQPYDTRVNPGPYIHQDRAPYVLHHSGITTPPPTTASYPSYGTSAAPMTGAATNASAS